MENRLLGLFLVFAPLSLLSFGGGQAIIADMQHQTVDVHGYLTNQQFADLFAVSRAAPGPTTLIAALLGYQVAGVVGALVSCFAIYAPSSLLVYGVSSWWQRHRGSPLKTAIERGLAPVAVGLIFAGAYAVMRAAHPGALQLATLAVATAVFTFTKIGPYAMIGAVSLVFAIVHTFA